MVDVIVVGAGIGGLAAAIDLARRGAKVQLFEAADELGGKLGVFEDGGVRYDTGASLLTMVDVFDELFADAGFVFRDLVELTPVSTSYSWPTGERVVLGGDAATACQSVGEAFGVDAERDLAKFLRYAERIWAAAAPAFVYADAPSLRGSMGRVGLLTQIDPLRTMWAGIKAHVRHPCVRDILARFATYNGSDPRRAPATLNCIAHVELALGGYGIRGGMHELITAHADVARALGVEIHTGAPVEHIVVRDNAVRGVLVHGDMVRCDAVVSNAEPGATDELLGRKATALGERSMSAYNALVRVGRPPTAAHTVLFPARYHREFEEIFDQRHAPTDPAVYLCAPQLAHRITGNLVFVMTNAPAGDTSDASTLRTRALERLRRAGLAPHDVVWERTPTQLAARFPHSDGALYGASSNARFAAFRRPHNRHPTTTGLYLTGGSTHPGGGVPMCALSGRTAARALTADLFHVKQS